MADLKAFAEQLVNLTVKEVNELATILKDEYGIEPAAAGAVMVAGPAAGGGAGDGGEAAAVNLALKNAIGEYVLIVNADDPLISSNLFSQSMYDALSNDSAF